MGSEMDNSRLDQAISGSGVVQTGSKTELFQSGDQEQRKDLPILFFLNTVV